MNATQKAEARAAMLKLCISLISVVEGSGAAGAAGGVLYAALLVPIPDLSAAHFAEIMAACTSTGLIEKRGDRYFKKGA